MTAPTQWTLTQYVTPKGETPMVTFLDGLTGKNQREAAALLQFIKERGNLARPPQSKLVETGLFELRGHQVRIFYIFLPDRRIVLLDGMIKKQDEIPAEVLDRVRGYRRAVEAAEKKKLG